MHDDCASRALFRGNLELVGPTAVVRHRLAAEERLVLQRRVADEHDDDLAADIDPLVIVPVVLRRDDTIADE